LQPEIRRPSASDLLSFELLSPNEADDFLEVRFHLETVAEQALGLEDDEDNSDEEPVLSTSQRENQSSQRKQFVDRSESKSFPRLQTGESSDSLDRPEFLRAKTLPILDQQSVRHVDQALAAGPLSDPRMRDTLSEVKASPEKTPKHDPQPPNSGQPIAHQSTPQSISDEASSQLSPTPSSARRRLSGNEIRKTGSRVVRVCLPEGGPRGRSSSFIDVPLSPVVHEVPSTHQLPLLPHPSPMSAAIPIQASHQINLHHIFSADADAAHPFTTTGATASLSKSPPEENFLGVVDVGDKGSGGTDDDSKSEDCLIFRLRVPFESTFKEIEFEFDLLCDHPQSIVDEMNEVDELIFLTPYAKQIVDSLTPIVDVAQRVLREKKIQTGQETNSQRKHRTALSNLVLEKLLAMPGEFDDRALAAWSNAAEERRTKENEISTTSSHHTTQRPHHLIQVNLAAAGAGNGTGTGTGTGEINRSTPPSTEREDLIRGVASSEWMDDQSPPKAVRSTSRNINQGVGDVATPSNSHVRDKASVTSPTKISSDQEGLQTMSIGLSHLSLSLLTLDRLCRWIEQM
jgi:hypothetical protein